MTVADSITQYESLRALLLGSELGLRITLPPLLLEAGPADFDAFVSSAYVVVREALAEDAAFLAHVGVLKAQDASRSIYLLRTARQHTDNELATSFYGAWLGPHPVDWAAAAARLTAQIEDFFQALIQAALAVRASPLLHQQWIEAVAVSVPSTFDAVCRDLRLSYRNGARAAKIRAIEGRYRREKLTGPKSRIIADLCIQEVLSETGLLPVPHSELLDELGLLGEREAAAALALAYTTARALPGLRGEGFSRKVSTMWWSLVGEDAR